VRDLQRFFACLPQSKNPLRKNNVHSILAKYSGFWTIFSEIGHFASVWEVGRTTIGTR